MLINLKQVLRDSSNQTVPKLKGLELHQPGCLPTAPISFILWTVMFLDRSHAISQIFEQNQIFQA
jgi:hypothetical protein